MVCPLGFEYRKIYLARRRKMNLAVLLEFWNQKRHGLFVFQIRFAEAQFEFDFFEVFEEKGMGGGIQL
ncbi:MAG: hypothetical protein AABZ00_15790 [Chloroflexota bacterium]